MCEARDVDERKKRDGRLGEYVRKGRERKKPFNLNTWGHLLENTEVHAVLGLAQCGAHPGGASYPGLSHAP